ncbi:hypothetical protein V0288_10795 [Pannus brasiliensis CCIBt3594]|uniref:Uncharacterized protein n=1 Tax=Pannus brasiliensis CCIBt3594 TaxID=1427578 RepID=A0AAW9QS05_9CHRO
MILLCRPDLPEYATFWGFHVGDRSRGNRHPHDFLRGSIGLSLRGIAGGGDFHRGRLYRSPRGRARYGRGGFGHDRGTVNGFLARGFHDLGVRSQESGVRREEGGRSQESGGKREAGGRRQEAGGRRQEAGGRR